MNNSKTKLPQIPNKRYFTIGEVAFLCAVKPHVLRYWEQEFPQLRPSKRRGNRRYYQREDVVMVRHIRELLYDEGYTIIGARIQLDQLLKQPKTSKPQSEFTNEISFVVEPEPFEQFDQIDQYDYKSFDQQKAFNRSHDNAQSIFNPAEFLENHGPNADNSQEYCTLTELEQIAEQLKLEQVHLTKLNNTKIRNYKLTMDEIVFELKEILSDIRTNKDLLVEA